MGERGRSGGRSAPGADHRGTAPPAPLRKITAGPAPAPPGRPFGRAHGTLAPELIILHLLRTTAAPVDHPGHRQHDDPAGAREGKVHPGHRRFPLRLPRRRFRRRVLLSPIFVWDPRSPRAVMSMIARLTKLRNAIQPTRQICMRATVMLSEPDPVDES